MSKDSGTLLEHLIHSRVSSILDIPYQVGYLITMALYSDNFFRCFRSLGAYLLVRKMS
jgi:hypothetical protein